MENSTFLSIDGRQIPIPSHTILQHIHRAKQHFPQGCEGPVKHPLSELNHYTEPYDYCALYEDTTEDVWVTWKVQNVYWIGKLILTHFGCF